MDYIKQIANLITEDPDILNEMDVGFRELWRKAHNGGVSDILLALRTSQRSGRFSPEAHQSLVSLLADRMGLTLLTQRLEERVNNDVSNYGGSDNLEIHAPTPTFILTCNGQNCNLEYTFSHAVTLDLALWNEGPKYWEPEVDDIIAFIYLNALEPLLSSVIRNIDSDDDIQIEYRPDVTAAFPGSEDEDEENIASIPYNYNPSPDLRIPIDAIVRVAFDVDRIIV